MACRNAFNLLFIDFEASNLLVLYVFENDLIILDLVAVFAWEAYERGSDVHLQADPTKLELLHNSFKVKKEDFKEKQGDSILKKVKTQFKKINYFEIE